MTSPTPLACRCGKTQMEVIGVEDVAACRQALLRAGIAAAEIADYGFVQVCDTQDPHGNRVSFVQLMS
ncbi:hypothetical protein CO614_01530 [Lysobacteraceae bacterium NML120232]|nr:hypothetical protein CO608_01285 [Xanthomonadaceae bacterium NML08-0793]PJK13377.1 hypothetical protein CO614_01530 [Xanthomonadaceae bacterium NML120232]